jgi:hypothetical protein
MLHAQQNDERSAERAGIEDYWRRTDLHFEVVWVRQCDGRPARRKREPSQLGGLTFQAELVDSQTSDFRFKRLPRNPEFGSRT